LYEDNFIAYSERANVDENYNSPSNKINDLSGNKEEKKRILKKMTKKLLIKKKKREKVIKRKKMRKKIQSNKKI
jgi:hypothetical protein